VLSGFRPFKSEILAEGKNKTLITHRLDDAFESLGWKEREFETKLTVDTYAKRRRSKRSKLLAKPVESMTYGSQTHAIDCLKNRVGLEIEWNSKDQTFVRDLNNFRVLFDMHILDVGVIVTRADELQELVFDPMGDEIANKYGESTTHMSKLRARLEGGAAGGCPVLVFGITRSLYVEDV